MNNQLLTNSLTIANSTMQTPEDIVDITPYIIAAGVLILLFIIWKICKKYRPKKGKNIFQKKLEPSLENSTIEEIDSAMKSIYDDLGSKSIQKTQGVMKEELEKNLSEYKDDDTYMLPEEKARQILLEMVRLAVVQRNDMINQFIYSTEAGKIYSVVDRLIDEVDSYENDARSKYRITKAALKEKIEAETELDKLKYQSVRSGKEESEPSKEECDNQRNAEQETEKEFENDVRDAQ